MSLTSGLVSDFFQAVEHSKIRKQFGSTLASFQHTQFQLADMAAK